MKTILILAANPKHTSPLRLDEEVREIDNVLRRAKRRDEFVLKQQWAVRARDVQAAMLDFNPQIVHFSGHGTGEEGLALEDETGQVKLVDTAALAGLFQLFSEQLECLILNACYSEVQADAIAQYINYVIGMNQPIGDKAAIEFAVGFYNALGAGRSYEEAYKFGCNAIQLAGITEFQTPVLRKKENLTTFKAMLESDTKQSHQQARRKELQQEYDAISEEIQFLRKSLRMDDLSPRERFRLQKQIEDAEEKRMRLVEQIEQLEK